MTSKPTVGRIVLARVVERRKPVLEFEPEPCAFCDEKDKEIARLEEQVEVGRECAMGLSCSEGWPCPEYKKGVGDFERWCRSCKLIARAREVGLLEAPSDEAR